MEDHPDISSFDFDDDDFEYPNEDAKFGEEIVWAEPPPPELPDSQAALVFHFGVKPGRYIWGEEAAAAVLDVLEMERVSGRVEYYAADIGGEYLVALAFAECPDEDSLVGRMKARVRELPEALAIDDRREGTLEFRRVRRTWIRSVRRHLFLSGAALLSDGDVVEVLSDPEEDTWFTGAVRERW